MLIKDGQILTGSTQTIATKKGDHLQKTRLKVLDLGPEANGGDVYWIDFLGDARSPRTNCARSPASR